MTMEVLLPWITIIIAVLTAIGFFDAKRKINMEDGAKIEKQKSQNDEIKCLKMKLDTLEKATFTSEKDVSEIKITLHYLAEAMARIESKVDTLAPPTIPHSNNKSKYQEE